MARSLHFDGEMERWREMERDGDDEELLLVLKLEVLKLEMDEDERRRWAMKRDGELCRHTQSKIPRLKRG